MAVRVFHLTGTGPQEGLPTDVDEIHVFIFRNNSIVSDVRYSLESLRDVDGDGPEDRELRLDLPADETVSVAVFAYRGLLLVATARADGLRVARGMRRYVDLTFTPVNTVTDTLQSLRPGRFAHTATTLPGDGRVLLAGGFVSASPTSCPGPLSTAEVCFRLTATDEAVFFDPATARLHSARGKMLRPRALHTATLLPDGRVLVVGGLSSAVLGLVRKAAVEPSTNMEYWPYFVPPAAADLAATAATYEIFDPSLNQEEEDRGRDGDVRAGGFIGGSADGSSPGFLKSPRYLHAATTLPGPRPGALVVGGKNSGEAAVTAEVFLQDDGGEGGFHPTPVRLANALLPKESPAAVTMADQVWVIGGALDFESPEQLVEQWRPGDEEEWSPFTDLQGCEGWGGQGQPRHAPVFPRAVVFGQNRDRVYVSGWLGPLCEPGRPEESFAGTEPCSSQRYESRAFMLEAQNCLTSDLLVPEGYDAEAHLLGDVAALPDGRALVAGGFVDGSLHVTDRVELIEFDESSNGGRTTYSEYLLRLADGRAWLTATQVPGGRILFAGGMSLQHEGGAGVPQSLRLFSTVELYDAGLIPVTVGSP